MSRTIQRQITYGGRLLIGYFVAPTKDGIVFGFKNKELGDIHLTLFWKEGKIRTHITDKTMPEGPLRVPWGQQFTPDLISKRITDLTRTMVRPQKYDLRTKAWVLKAPFGRKLLELGTASIDTGSIPIELYKKIEDQRSWTRMPVRTLIGKERIAITGDRLRWVVPVDEKNMLTIRVRQHLMLYNLLLKELGFERYWSYVKPKMQRIAIQSRGNKANSTSSQI